MPHSMTAFARQSTVTSHGELTWELRSVNHRYLEMSMRLPDELRAFEGGFREAIQHTLKRGRVDGVLRFNATTTDAESLDVDTQLVNQLSVLGKQLRDLDDTIQPLRTIDVLTWPGVVKTPELDENTLNKTALALLQNTLSELLQNRRREGRRLITFISQRLDGMDEIVTGVRELLPEISESAKLRLRQKVSELCEQIDQNRMEQEIAVLLNKLDVDEEMDRLAVHITEVRRVLNQDEAVGRRLDFLMQELNREANTLGSKSVDSRTTNASVELKVLIDQMREQIQNIE